MRCIDIRTAVGGLQDVSRKWWNPPCRSCLLASAASSDFYNSVASTMRSGLVSTSSHVIRNRRLAPREDFWSKRDCLERQGLLLLSRQRPSCRYGYTHRSNLGLNRHHLDHFKSSTELCRACCDVRHLVKLFLKRDIHQGTTSQRGGEGGVICRGFCGVQGKRSEDTAFQN